MDFNCTMFHTIFWFNSWIMTKQTKFIIIYRAFFYGYEIQTHSYLHCLSNRINTINILSTQNRNIFITFLLFVTTQCCNITPMPSFVLHTLSLLSSIWLMPLSYNLFFLYALALLHSSPHHLHAYPYLIFRRQSRGWVTWLTLILSP